MVGIRFGETIKSYVERWGTAEELTGIPLAIAGWLRYLLGVDDNGEPFEIAPDPRGEDIRAYIQKNFSFGNAQNTGDQLKPVLSNANIFGIDLYEAGIGKKIEEMFAEETAGPGAVRDTLRRYLQ